MAVDYDLVVIGGSAAGVQAAMRAAQLKARVGLVEQGLLSTDGAGVGGDRVLLEVGRALQQVRRAAQFGVVDPASAAVSASDLKEQVSQWAAAVTSGFAISHSTAVLSSLGIEVIPGFGEFYRKPKVGFTVNGRSLRSRAYLLAPGVRSAVPAIAGLKDCHYWTAETVLHQFIHSQPFNRLVIIGTAAIGVELAQTFSWFGVEVMLITPAPHILPHADPEAARLIQAQLEAEGVRVLTHATVSQIRQIQGKRWVQAGDRAIETDEILLATEPEPDVASFNLAAAGVHSTAQGIAVNKKLQTTNRLIYACTAIAGNSMRSSVSDRSGIAVNNALFLARQSVFDRSPHVINVSPELASVGLTEPEAIATYGKQVFILRQSYRTIVKAQLQGEITGFCKLIVQPNGKILGAHLVGQNAGELIGTIALAIQQNLKIQALVNLALPSPTLSEIISQTAADWQRLRLANNPKLQNFLERFFNWRRSWS